jgi:hypothetical protein
MVPILGWNIPHNPLIPVAPLGIQQTWPVDIEGHGERTEWHAQALPASLHVRLFTRPAAEERVDLCVAGHAVERRRLVRMEVPAGNVHHVSQWPNLLDIDTNLGARNRANGCTARVREIEVQRSVSGQQGLAPLARHEVQVTRILAGVLTENPSERDAAGETSALVGTEDVCRCAPAVVVRQNGIAFDIRLIEIDGPDVNLMLQPFECWKIPVVPLGNVHMVFHPLFCCGGQSGLQTGGHSD